MSIGYVRGMRLLRRAFRPLPAGERLHIFIRYLTCPFTRVLRDVPAGARVLEIGSGHALFSLLMAEDGASEVVAVDPDLRKSLLPSPSLKVRKIAGFDDCIAGTFDAVAISDVAYRLSLDMQRALFARVFDRLRPGGVFVLKEMDPEHRWKMSWTRAQEWLNDTFLGITLGSGVVYATRGELQAILTNIGFVQTTSRSIDGGYPHPHIVYTAHKPK